MAHQAEPLTLTINGQVHTLALDPQLPLLWVLRDILKLKGTKYGCGVGVCGICVVHLNGEPVQACMIPACEAANRAVTTIEGISPDHPVFKGWIKAQASQCGYCQPGQVMAAAALLAHHPKPDEPAISAAMAGVLCRCGAYPRIRRAIGYAAEFMSDAPSAAISSQLPAASQAPAALQAPAAPQAPVAEFEDPDALVLNPWVRIDRQGYVTVIIDRAEMGQGVTTALAQLVAEELEVAWSQVRITLAPAAQVYTNTLIGEQLTGGSTSVRAAFEHLRQAGASAREQLITAAAQVWAVPPHTCRAEHGSVMHPASGQRLSYGVLIDAARTLPAPAAVRLKDPADFRLIGHPLPRLDLPLMIRGQARYGLDVDLPDLLTASIERPPRLGDQVKQFDARQALAVSGVRQVLAVPSGIAVIAEHTHAALAGRAALVIEWQTTRRDHFSSEAIREQLRQAGARSGQVNRQHGDAPGILAHGAAVIEAAYETPYLAHAPMEPMNCTAHVTDTACHVWVGTQAHTATQEAAARVANLAPGQVVVHSQFLGGGFGRRGDVDFVEEAVDLSKRTGRPIKLMWTRTDDMRHDRFRPASYTLVRATLDDAGWPLAWFQRVVGPELVFNGLAIPYHIPHLKVEFVEEDPGVPTGAWRSVGASQNAFTIEGFIDELATRAGCDPLAYRLSLLAHTPAKQRVLALAAERAGWDQPPPPGRARGVAFYESFKSSIAQIAEVEVNGREIKVRRVVCVADCGQVINPDIVAAQLEGGIIFGASATLFGEITLDQGQVQQATFRDYPILTLAQAPSIEVHLIPSHTPPGGVGEPGVPPIAPAIANAVFQATGQRLRRLPLRL